MKDPKVDIAFYLKWKAAVEQAREYLRDPEGLYSAFLQGWAEGLGNVGMTFDGDAESPRSVAYDRGRALRQKQEGMADADRRAE